MDSAGNVYVADSGNHTIRKVTSAGVVTTLAGLAGSDGSADGMGSAARFEYPSGVAADSAGNVYVADWANQTIRKVTPAGVVATLAGMVHNGGGTDGTGSAARFDYPTGAVVDSAGNVHVAGAGYHTIRKLAGFRRVGVAITSHPKARPPSRANVTLSVSATGTEQLFYQWRKNGNLIANANSPSLELNNVQLSNSGVYSVMVSNPYGTVASTVARLSVYLPPPTPQPSPPAATSTAETPPSALTAAPRKPSSAQLVVFNGGGLVDRNKMTIVLTHGWKSSCLTGQRK